MSEVGIAELRRTLKDWVDRARAGDDVIITDRGRAVARLTAIDATSLIDRLEAEGRISRPASSDRPRARGRQRVRAKGDVSALIAEGRAARR